MATHDVRKEDEKIDRIKWVTNPTWDLIKHRQKGITFSNGKLVGNGTTFEALVSTKEETLNLIKALEKAIELGWVK